MSEPVDPATAAPDDARARPDPDAGAPDDPREPQAPPAAEPAPTPPRRGRAHGLERLIAPVLVAAAAIVGLVYRAEVTAWFRGAAPAAAPAAPAHDHDHAGGGASTPAPAPVIAPHTFPPAARDAVEVALRAYEDVRLQLAADLTDGLAGAADAVATAIETLHQADAGAPAEIHARAGDAVAAAQSLAGASDLAVARRHFADLSAALLALVSADPRLAEGRRIYECTMTDGFNRWIQPDGDDLANPYKGAAMQTCGAPLTLDEVFAAGADAPLDDPDAVDHWTCPMHPWVHQQGPGTCPVCGMELTPVTAEEVRSGVIRVEGERRQEIGVRVQPIARAPMTIAIRAVGLVAYDERSQADVSLKFGGWIERLYVNETGQRVRAGQTLFTIYSPEVYAAQQEWLLALDARDAARDDVNRRRADAMVAAARRRLELWDLGAATLDKIAAKHAPLQYVPIAAPASGYVVDKDVVAGAAVDAGHRLFRIAALDRVWVEAQIYEQDLAEVKVGQPARVTLGHLPGKIFEGKVTFVAPSLDAGTRTASVRIELPNRDLALRPNMYASVELTTDVGERLQVPESAIIYSGPRRIVFVDLGGDRLAPRQVTLGLKAGSAYEVLSGLEAGDQVVVSGNFLLASESRLKSATGLW